MFCRVCEDGDRVTAGYGGQGWLLYTTIVITTGYEDGDRVTAGYGGQGWLLYTTILITTGYEDGGRVTADRAGGDDLPCTVV